MDPIESTSAAPAPEPAATPAPAPDQGQRPADTPTPAPAPADPAAHAPNPAVEQPNRYEQLFKGAKVLTDPLIENGIKKPDQLTPLLDLNRTLSERGMSVSQLNDMLTGRPAEPASDPNAPLTGDSVKDLINQSLTEFDQNKTKQAHLTEFERDLQTMDSLSASTTTKVAEQLGLDPNSRTVRGVINELVEEALGQSAYPKGHSLRSTHYKPLDASQFESLIPKAIEAVNAERAALIASDAAQHRAMNDAPAQPRGNPNPSARGAPEAPTTFSPRSKTTAEEIARADEVLGRSRSGGARPAHV